MGDIHEWTILIVDEYGSVAFSKDEFQVWAKTMRGAVIKAENKIKKDSLKQDWKIRSVWWLNPNAPGRRKRE